MLKKYINKIVAAQPHIRSNHKIPMNRRQLLNQGYIALGGSVMLPAATATLLDSGKAWAQDCPADADASSASNTGVVAIDLGGGYTGPFNFPPIGQGGEPLAPGMLHSSGIPGDSLGDPNNGALDYTLGVGMNPHSHMLAGIRSTASATALAKIDGYLTCIDNNDDSRDNEHSLQHVMARAGYTGTVVPGVGQDESNSGGKSAVPAEFYDATRNPVVIRSINDAIATVLPATLSNYFGTEGYRLIFQMTQRWSVAEQAEFAAMSTEAQVKQLSKMLNKCPYEKAMQQVMRYLPEEVDLSNNPNLAAVWVGNEGPGSLVKMVSDGMAGIGTLSLGGFDYHNNGTVNCNDDDFRAGQMIGRVIEHFHRAGKNLMLSLYTDGGTGGPTSGGDIVDDTIPLVDLNGAPITDGNGVQIIGGGRRVGPTGDSGARGMRVTLFGNNTGGSRPSFQVNRPSTGSIQVGWYRGNNGIGSATVDSSATLASENPAVAVQIDILNMMIWDGKESEFATLFPQSPVLNRPEFRLIAPRT